MSGAIENLPVIVGSVSYIAGAAIDVYAQRKAQQERNPVSAEWEGLVEQPTLRRRMMGAAVGALAFVAAGAGYVNADAWQPDTPENGGQPFVGVVADLSGSTALENGKPAETVKQFAEVIAEQADADAEIIVANGGESPTISVEELNNQVSTGDARLDEATQQVLENIRVSQSEATSNSPNNSAVVVLSYGNPISGLGTVIQEAKVNGTRVFVVNVEDEASTNPDVSTQLKTVAEQTEGQYWNAADATPKQVTATVEDTLENAIVTEQKDSEPDSSPWPKRIFGALLLAGVPLTYHARKNMPLWFNKLKFKS